MKTENKNYANEYQGAIVEEFISEGFTFLGMDGDKAMLQGKRDTFAILPKGSMMVVNRK